MYYLFVQKCTHSPTKYTVSQDACLLTPNTSLCTEFRVLHLKNTPNLMIHVVSHVIEP